MKRMTLGLLLIAAPLAAPADPAPSAAEARALVERVEQIFRGDTAMMKAAMTIERPRWTRTVRFRSWDDRHADRAMVRILSPQKDRGTGFLRHGRTLWTYLPRVERTMRIPPSMMLQPWMGSDFTNDDLVRESSLIDDYTARDLGTKQMDGVRVHGVELLPLEEAPVVWSRMEIWLEEERLAPKRQIYYDEPERGRYEAVREMRFSDIREVQGRPLPHVWEMVSFDKQGHVTRVELEEIRFDDPFDDEIFSQANLKRAEAVR